MLQIGKTVVFEFNGGYAITGIIVAMPEDHPGNCYIIKDCQDVSYGVLESWIIAIL